MSVESFLLSEDTVDILKNTALKYNRLLNIRYCFKVAKKSTLHEINLVFKSYYFYHLIGMQYLDDLSFGTTSKERIYKKILNDQITLNDLKKSVHYTDDIEERIKYFSKLEEILDNDHLTFLFNPKSLPHVVTGIKAKFLLVSEIKKENVDNQIAYFFIDEDSSMDNYYFSRSFFLKKNTDYTVRQSKMALLYKEKVYIEEDNHLILINKLNQPEKKETKRVSIEISSSLKEIAATSTPSANNTCEPA